MRESAWERAQRTPVTWVVVIAYLAMAFVTFADTEQAKEWREAGLMVPHLVSEGQPWRLISHAFLHGNLLHLGFNTIVLIWIGPPLELALGSLRFVVLYVVSAVGGAVAVALVNSPMQPVLGGSGALFGMMGAAVALHLRSSRHMMAAFDQRGPRMLLTLIGINLLFGLLPGISNTAHIGGLIGGTCLVLVFFDFGQWESQRSTKLAFAVAGLGLLVHTLLPVTRWDWLQNRAADSNDPVVAAELGEAAQRSAIADGELGELLWRTGRPQPVQGDGRRRGG